MAAPEHIGETAMAERNVGIIKKERTGSPNLVVANDGYPPPAYGWYVVGVLTLAYVFSFLDRQILSLLVEPMKADLDLNDTQISLLQGLAFAVCNALAGLPLGRLVDTQRRTTLVAAGIAFWSVATASYSMSVLASTCTT